MDSVCDAAQSGGEEFLRGHSSPLVGAVYAGHGNVWPTVRPFDGLRMAGSGQADSGREGPHRSIAGGLSTSVEKSGTLTLRPFSHRACRGRTWVTLASSAGYSRAGGDAHGTKSTPRSSYLQELNRKVDRIANMRTKRFFVLATIGLMTLALTAATGCASDADDAEVVSDSA